MVSRLSAPGGFDYYACTDEFEGGEENVSEGRRKRWKGEPQFKVEDPAEESMQCSALNFNGTIICITLQFISLSYVYNKEQTFSSNNFNIYFNSL